VGKADRLESESRKLRLVRVVTRAAGVVIVAAIVFAGIWMLSRSQRAEQYGDAAATGGEASSAVETSETASATAAESVAASAEESPTEVTIHGQTYARSQEGLQSYLDYLDSVYDIRISVDQLDGSWEASIRGDEESVSASTYKVFVAVYLLNQIADGTLTYDSAVSGRNAEECLTSMIEVSDNDCALAFLNGLGRDAINQYFWDRGYSTATNLNVQESTGTTVTSVDDLTKLMSEIYDSTILSGSERDLLLSLMQKQVYREGIPAGSSGTVSDKVGFLNAYLNDTAIVETASGDYALSIISDGATWATLASITSAIEDIMYSS
jgi:beta-lactamase class A